jgi:hypothetical protein
VAVSKWIMYPPKLLVPDDQHRAPLVASWRLALPCGCCCAVGTRVDTGLVGAEFTGCCPGHAASSELGHISEALAQAVSGPRDAADMLARLMGDAE